MFALIHYSKAGVIRAASHAGRDQITIALRRDFIVLAERILAKASAPVVVRRASPAAH